LVILATLQEETMSSRLIPASELVPLPLSWLWKGRIPLGALAELIGAPGQAKSSLTCDLIARVTTGKPMPGCAEPSAPADVILLQAEDHPANTVVPCLKAAGADLSRVHLCECSEPGCQPLVFPDDIDIIEAAAAEHKVRLIVLDPVASYIRASLQNEQSVRKALTPFVAIAKKYGLAVLMVRHLRKTGGRDPVHLGAGTIAFVALVRASLLVGNDPASDDPYRHVLTVSKSNLGSAPSMAYRTFQRADETIAVEWLGETETTAKDIALATGSTTEASAFREAAYVLYSLLCNGPLPASEVAHRATQARVASRTLYRAKAALGVKSIKRGSGAGSQWFWQLPDDDRSYRAYKEHDFNCLMDRLCHGPSKDDLSGSFTDFPDSHKPSAGDHDDEQLV
jgi:hypothetical protein